MTIEAPPLWLQGGTYPARLMRFALAEMREEGVANATACKVTQRGAGANFSVDVATGTFWVAGDDQSLQGTYQDRITATENVAISAAPGGSNQRYDLVTLRVNDPNAGGNSGNTVTVVVVAGTPSTTPAVPSLPASSLPLAVVGPITSSTASITNAIIHDCWTGTGPAYAASCRLLAGERSPVAELRLRATNPDKVSGWLHCNGQAVSRSTYAALFAELGTSFGAGDGSTTFNVPDYRDRVPVTKGSSFATVGATGGEINHTLTSGEMPSHNHGGTTGIESATHTHGFSGTTTGQSATHTHGTGDGRAFSTTDNGATSAGSGAEPMLKNYGYVNATAGASNDHTHDYVGVTAGQSVNHTHTVSSQGSGDAHNNMPPYQVAGGWMIKAT